MRVRRSDAVQISLDEQALLRRQVQLQLQTLGLLALQQRNEGFASGLSDLQQFIERWFVLTADNVASAMQQLQSLQQLELNPEWPAL